MNYNTKIKWSFISAIIASILWVIGDLFVAGFNVNPADYPLFSETYADQIDVGIAVLMLEGSTERLMFGALVAAMSAYLFLPAVWLATQYFKDRSKWYSIIVYFILIISVVLMPLGHAIFYFVGEIFKSIYHTDPIAHPYLLETAKGFTTVLYITWGIAIFVLLLGWFLFSIMVFLGKTILPKWVGFISPVFLAIYQFVINSFLPSSDIKGWLGSAGFNIAYLIFFLILYFSFRKLLFQKQVDLT